MGEKGKGRVRGRVRGRVVRDGSKKKREGGQSRRREGRKERGEIGGRRELTIFISG
jgi:hypothetical protein